MAAEREKRIEEAIAGCAKAPVLTMSVKHAIPRSTLRHRQGGTTARNAKVGTQNLSPKDKECFADWIENEEAAGRAPTKKDTRAFAQLFLNQSSKPGEIGHN